MKLGEYANFQDDLMPLDMDCPVTKETQYNPNTDSIQSDTLTGNCNEIIFFQVFVSRMEAIVNFT